MFINIIIKLGKRQKIKQAFHIVLKLLFITKIITKAK